MLDGILAQAMQGGVVIVPPLQQKVVEKLGKPGAIDDPPHVATSRLAQVGPRHPNAPRAMLVRAKIGKKLPGTLTETLAHLKNERPLCLMFQDGARFERISDTRYC